MPHSRPMPGIGSRCHELRIVDVNATWRMVYRVDPAPRRSRSSTCLGSAFGSTTMREEKRKRLEAKGWRVGSTREFLELSPEEEAYVELRLRLADGLKKRRVRRHLTQTDLAKIVRSSQSRVAKMESGDLTVSLDLLIRSLLALGASRKDLAQIISDSKSIPAS